MLRGLPRLKTSSSCQKEPLWVSEVNFGGVFLQKSSGPGILKSFVSGNGVRVIKQRSDAEVVQMCVAMLARMFPEQVPFTFLSSFRFLVSPHWILCPHLPSVSETIVSDVYSVCVSRLKNVCEQNSVVFLSPESRCFLLWVIANGENHLPTPVSTFTCR